MSQTPSATPDRLRALRPCPNCGSDAEHLTVIEVQVARVGCEECGMWGPTADTQDGAMALWDSLPRRGVAGPIGRALTRDDVDLAQAICRTLAVVLLDWAVRSDLEAAAASDFAAKSHQAHEVSWLLADGWICDELLKHTEAKA